MYKILIVEDDPVIASSLARQLTRWNYEATYVQEFDHVMQEFEKAQPDLVLMDYHLPKINGVKGVEMLRREDPEVPLIVFTIEDNQRVADQFLDAGASDFVLKPVKALDIIARIKLHVRLVESRRENRQSTEEPVKGIGQGTLSLIEGYLRSVSEYQPVEAIAEGTGLAYQTTYRYLQYLVSVNRVEVSQHYGKVGRPKQRYRMIREAGDGEKPETGL